MHHPKKISGVFTVIKSAHRTSINQQDYLRLTLENAFESITANCWLNSYSGPHSFCDDEIVHIAGHRKQLDFKEIADIYKADIVLPSGSEILTSIPRSSVTDPNHLNDLISLASSICTDPLQNFIYEAFFDRDFARLFFTLPASHQFHHFEAGGLLRHSIECAQIVAQCPSLKEIDRDFGIVAALFHDAGKTLTMDMQRKTKLGYLVDHDSLTLEALHRPLSNLDCTWPDAGIALRHIWSCRSQRQWGYKEKMPVAIVVQMADRISAETEMGNQLFSTVEPWKNHVKHPVSNQRFWRPSRFHLTDKRYENIG